MVVHDIRRQSRVDILVLVRVMSTLESHLGALKDAAR